MRRFWSFALFFFLLLLAGCTPSPAEEPTGPSTGGTDTLPTLTTVIFSIGKADAILLHNEAHAILIDAGETEDATEVLAYLNRQKITHLDALIVTHYDKDHVGGAAGILHDISVGAVYGTYPSKESEEYTLYAEALAKVGLSATVVRQTTTLQYGDIHLTIYPPEKTSYERKQSNNSSLVIHMTYGETKYLFAGDAQEERVSELLSLGEGLDCDLLKAPYHGNVVENLPALLQITTPQYAVVTCSDKNPAAAEKVAALQEAGARVFLTRMGNVYAKSDGKTLEVMH